MASSVSSFEESILDEKSKAAAEGGSASGATKPEPPLIIHDSKEMGDKPSALLDDMPDVLGLPEPSSVTLPKSDGTTPLNQPSATAEKK
jgi:hypothetical protein